MGRSRGIIGLVAAWIVTLLAIGLVVAQNAAAQETPLPNAQAYVNRGNAYYNNRDFDRAIADYTQAIQLDPKYALPYNNRGLVYRAKGDLTVRRVQKRIGKSIWARPRGMAGLKSRAATDIQAGFLGPSRGIATAAR